jgi:hypothetical protein
MQLQTCFDMPAKLDDPFEQRRGISAPFAPYGNKPRQIAALYHNEIEIETLDRRGTPAVLTGCMASEP